MESEAANGARGKPWEKNVRGGGDEWRNRGAKRKTQSERLCEKEEVARRGERAKKGTRRDIKEIRLASLGLVAAHELFISCHTIQNRI